MSEDETTVLRDDLVDWLIEKDVLHSKGVEAAFREVPRHLFVPDVPAEEAYKNRAIPTKKGESGLAISSSSQPAIMVIMLEQLDLQRGENVLEIGAGTGFNAALMGHMVGEGGHVTTMDIDLDIVEGAREHLAAAGCENVTVVCGDGAAGFPGNGPYDAIILTVGGWEITPAWLEQLKPDGRIVLPLSLNGPQFSIAFEWEGGGMVSRSIETCSFMALRGDNVDPEVVVPLSKEKTFGMAHGAEREIDAGRVMGLLDGGGVDTAVGLHTTPAEIWQGFMLWVALHEEERVSVGANGEGVGVIPLLVGGPHMSWGMTLGLVGEGGMAFYVRPSGEESEGEERDGSKSFELFVRGYGQAEGLFERLRGLALDWDENGRQGVEGMRVRVFPAGQGPDDGIVLERGRNRIVVDWP